MIKLYSGTPGSGKSLHIADKIYCLNARRIPIISTMRIDAKKLKHPELFYYYDIFDLTPSILIDFANSWNDSHRYSGFKEGYIICIIDEAQLLFNTRDFNVAGRKEWLQFFTMHRHYGYNFILATQWDRMLDKQLRALLEFEVVHRKLKNCGKLGFFVSYFLQLVGFGRTPFIAIEKYYPLKEKTGSYLFFGKKRLYKLYNTHEILKTDYNYNTMRKNIQQTNIKIKY